MGYLDNTVEYGFGQLGSGFLDDTDAFLPPSGLVIVAITVVDACKFTLLTDDDSQGIAYISTVTPVAANGTNAENISSTEVFPTGITIYGRYTAVTLSQGSVICYFGR
jgi:hypothetical protein